MNISEYLFFMIIDKYIKNIENEITKRFSKEDAVILKRSLVLAVEQHKEQKRKFENIPYVVHPIRVAHILMTELNLEDKDIVVASLLHDVVEDCDYSLKSIGGEFGKNVKELVDIISQRSGESKDEFLNRIFNSGNLDVKVLKVADRLDNIRAFKVGSGEKYNKFKSRYIKETEEILGDVSKVNKYLYKELLKTLDLIK